MTSALTPQRHARPEVQQQHGQQNQLATMRSVLFSPTRRRRAKARTRPDLLEQKVRNAAPATIAKMMDGGRPSSPAAEVIQQPQQKSAQQPMKNDL